MQVLAILLIGFSIFTAVLLLLANILQNIVALQYSSKLAEFTLISALAVIQWLNLQFILDQTTFGYSYFYIALLYSIAPCFYFYSRQLLMVDVEYHSWQWLHALPIFFSLFLSYSWALPLAFLVGSLYLCWLAQAVYSLRKQRQRFKQEMLVLATFFVIAIAVILLGFIWPMISKETFIVWYSILIGVAFFCTGLTLIRFPTITSDIAEAVQVAYAESSLNNVDRKKILTQLARLMKEEKLYLYEDLSLGMLAEQLQLSSHQLSELINTEFQQGFSRYIRHLRVKEAQEKLIAEPAASVLSIGLSVGFSTQSNFYTAFRDITGLAPGQYRKQFFVHKK